MVSFSAAKVIEAITSEVSDFHRQIVQAKRMNEFGTLLRQWRKRRHYSQLSLASVAELSSRHLSFLESGRAKPSRSMVLRLVHTLDVPPAEANVGLVSAGFAPAYPQCAPDDASVAMLQRAIHTTIENHAPWPAVACDGQWNLLQANTPAIKLFTAMGIAGATNLVEAMFLLDHPESPLVNWTEVAYSLLQRLRTESLEQTGNSPLHAFIQRLSKHPRLVKNVIETPAAMQVVIPMQLKLGDQQLSLFSMIAQFGSVQEVTLSTVRLELSYPADEATTRYFETL